MIESSPWDSAFPLRGTQLLVVEDEILIAAIAEEMLLGAGARAVILAHDEPRARAALNQPEPVDGAVIDLNLGGQAKAGLDLAELACRRGIPLLIATGYARSLALPATLANTRVVTKPYTVAGLVDALGDAIVERRMQPE